MKKIVGMIAVLVLVCFTTMAFAVDLASPAASVTEAAKSAAKDEAVKAVSGQTVIGKIKKIDTKANTILVNNSTINVKAEDIANLKVGNKVKVTLAAGTMDAEKIVAYKGKEETKKAVKKEAKKAKEKAVEKAAEKAVEKMGQ